MSKLKQFVYALFTQIKKKAVTKFRNCLIFKVDQPGLEICCYDVTHRADFCCRLKIRSKFVVYEENHNNSISHSISHFLHQPR